MFFYFESFHIALQSAEERNFFENFIFIYVNYASFMFDNNSNIKGKSSFCDRKTFASSLFDESMKARTVST